MLQRHIQKAGETSRADGLVAGHAPTRAWYGGDGGNHHGYGSVDGAV